jgi:hypothetical protein
MPSDRTGLLIIRAWLEGESTQPLRAHVRVTDDVSTGIQRTVTLAQPDRVSELVDSWLRGILALPTDAAADAPPEIPAADG